MWILPLAAAVIALVFAVLLGSQFASRHRPFQALWAVALLMYSAASFAMFMGVVNEWSLMEFKIYWLFGAVLNVPFLAQGEVHLLFERKWLVNGLLALVALATLVSIFSVLSAQAHAGALSRSLPLGKDVLGKSTLAYRLAQICAYPAYVFLVVGSVWSAMRMRGRPELRDRSVGTILIGVGATVVAAGSGIGAGLNVPWLFAVSLAVGIAVMFWGFLRAGHPTRAGQA